MYLQDWFVQNGLKLTLDQQHDHRETIDEKNNIFKSFKERNKVY